MTIAQVSLQTALSQNGISENPKGSNGGPEVNQYLRSVGLGAGYAWCMAFVYWCVGRACQDLGKDNPLIKTAGVLLQYNSTGLRKFPGRSTGAVKPGDIFIMKFSSTTGHTGFVEKIENGIVHTIEGNTNDDGSREGYEVAKRKRPVSAILGYIQLP